MNDQPAKKAKAATLESKVLQKSNESEENGNFSDVKPLKGEMWAASMGLNWKAHDELKESRILQDTHMQAAHTLIRKQFGMDAWVSVSTAAPKWKFSTLFVIKV